MIPPAITRTAVTIIERVKTVQVEVVGGSADRQADDRDSKQPGHAATALFTAEAMPASPLWASASTVSVSVCDREGETDPEDDDRGQEIGKIGSPAASARSGARLRPRGSGEAHEEPRAEALGEPAGAR